MWWPFCSESETYMIKYSDHGEAVRFMLTDLKNTWSNHVPKNTIYQQFTSLNTRYEISLEEAVNQVLKLIESSNNTGVSIKVERQHDELNLSLKGDYFTDSDDVKLKIKYEISFTKTDQNEFADNVTAPLIQTVKFLENQQRMLCNLLQKKDRELEEYRLEKGIISRSDLVTEKFEFPAVASSNEQLLLNVFDKSNSFWDNFTEKYGKIDVKMNEVEPSPWNKNKGKRIIYSTETSTRKKAAINYKTNA